MAAVRDTAVVRVSDTVNGQRRMRGKGKPKFPVERKVVDQRVMATLREVRRKGEAMVVLSETHVMLVPEQFRFGPPQGWMS